VIARLTRRLTLSLCFFENHEPRLLSSRPVERQDLRHCHARGDKVCSTVASAVSEARRSPAQHFGRDHERVWAAFPQALILAVSLRVPKENAGRRRIGCRVPEQRGRDRCCRFVMLCAAPAWLRAGSNGDLYRASMADVLRVVGILNCRTGVGPDGLERRRTFLPGTNL
jgi:hypothetical protein